MSVQDKGYPSNLARKNFRGSIFILFLTVGCLLTSLQVSAQNRNAGEIRGTITDQSGATIPGAKVAIKNILTGVTQLVISDSAGIYDAPDVPPGQYTLTFTKEGFKEFVRSGITLNLETITIDAPLQVGSVSEKVSVTAAAPLVQTETSDKSMTLTTVPVAELPDISRSWMNFTGLMPGVNGGGSSGNVAGGNATGEGVGVNGTGAYQANWLVDGAATMYPMSNNVGGQYTPIDDIAEVKMNVSNFSAEYGNGVAVFSVVTKSGTNNWHGSLYEFDQNDKFEARNFFSPSVAPLRWNDYGGTVGGPVKRDKLFFFFSVDRTDEETLSPTFATVPTAAMLGGDFSAPGLPTIYDPNTTTLVNGQYVRQAFPGNIIPSNRIDPVAKAIEQYFPSPNLPGIYNNFYANLAPSPQTWLFYSNKVDFNVSPSNRLSGSWSYNPGEVVFHDMTTVPVGPNGGIQLYWPFGAIQAQLTDVWTISPSIVNEARFGYLRQAGFSSTPTLGKGYPQKLGLINAAANNFPNVTIGGVVPAGIDGGVPGAVAVSNNFMPTDVVTWIRGKHMLKFGGEYNKWQTGGGGWPGIDAGDLYFSGIFTRNPADASSAGIGYGDFLLGLPQTWGDSQPPETGGRSWNTQLFVQDDYKVKPTLTLNIGVRYEIWAGWAEAFNRVYSFDPTITNPATNTLGAVWYGGQNGRTALEKTLWDVFDPRLGFAWAPTSNWSVRGGYGIFHMMRNSDSYGSGLGSGWGWSGYETSSDLMTPIFQLSQGLPSATFYPLPTGLTPDSKNGEPVSYEPYYTPMAYMQEVQFDVQRRIPGNIVVDAGYVYTRGVHLGFGRDIDQVPASLLGPGNAQLNRPYPQFQGISASLFDGYSSYHAFQLSLRKQFSQGLMFLVNYTGSKDMDTGMGSGWGGTYNIDAWQNAYDTRANYGLSTIDLPQTLNGAFIYQLPFGAQRRFLKKGGVLGAVVGGWQVSSIFQLHSGSPFTPVVGTANLDGSLAGSWYPNRIGNGKLANPTINDWFDTSAFVTPNPYTFGNSGRDVVRGPDYRDLDFGLAKDFPIRKLGEAGKFQIRADSFDIFNHPNFGQPNNAIGTPGAGVISSTVGAGQSSSGSTSRNIQLGLRLIF